MTTATLDNPTLGQTQIGNVVISSQAPMWDMSLPIITRPAMHNIAGVTEVLVMCRYADGVKCHRSLGLFANLDAIPQWIWDRK